MVANGEKSRLELVEQRKRQILGSARRVFAKNGFRRTKIDEITADLGIGKGTIYRYFSGKKSLFLAVYEQGMAELREVFLTSVEPINDPPRRVAAAVRTYFEFFDRNRDLIEIVMQVRSEFKDDYKRTYIAMYSDYIVKIQKNLRNGVSMGVFREMDVEKTAEAISASLQGVLQSFYVRQIDSKSPGRNPEKLADRAEALTAMLLQGLISREQTVG